MLAGLGKPRVPRRLRPSPPTIVPTSPSPSTTRLLHPGLRVICRAQSAAAMDAMQTCGVVEIINPFREFAERLTLAMRAPDTHRLVAWLTGAPGATLSPRCRRLRGTGPSAAMDGSARK